MNDRNKENAMPLPSQFTSYNGWPIGLKRWRKSPYDRPISEIVDQFIDNLSKKGDVSDKKVGDVVYRKLSSEENTHEKALCELIPFVPISQQWMFGILPDYLKEPT